MRSITSKVSSYRRWQPIPRRFIVEVLSIFLICCSSCTFIPIVEGKSSLSSSDALSTRHRHNNIDSNTDTSNLPTTLTRRSPSFLLRKSLSLSTDRVSSIKKYTDIDIKWSISQLRGGDVSDSEDDEYGSDEESESEYDSDEEYSDEYDDSDSEDESEEKEEDSISTSIRNTSLKSSLKSKVSKEGRDDGEGNVYDAMLTPPSMQQMMITVGVMLLANKIDILDAKAVRIARFAFVGYLIATEIFLAYVYIRAKSNNDRTPVTVSNPLAGLVPKNGGGTGGGGGGNFLVKALADQVLSTQTTILEYDLKQVKKVNGGLLFPMVFLYFLHFKMKQVQPLLMQTATGVMNLAYSPLFQVYVLGRNLERPFKPPVNPMMEAMQKQQEAMQQQEEEAEEGQGDEDEGDINEGAEDSDDDEEEVDEGDSEEDESDGEYDSEEE